jgi:putative tricarboxylic transport membrane protein
MRFTPLVIAAFSAAIASSPVAAQSWKPDRTLELIVGTAPGAAPDKTARLIQRVWSSKGIFDGAVAVVNKPGGGNLVAWTYLNQHAGDPHYLMIGNLNVLISRAIGRSPFAHTDFTWVATLFDEYFALSVQAASPFKTGRDLIDRLREDPTSVSIGVSTSIGGANHLSAALALQKAGIDSRKVRFVAFKGSANSIIALLGGHVDAVATAASSTPSHILSGRMRTIAVSSPKRLGGPLADSPTWNEMGFDATMTNFRTIIGPRGMDAAARTFWEQRLAALSEQAEWKDDLEKNTWVWNYMNGAATDAAVAESAKRVEALVNSLGLRKPAKKKQ